MKLLDIYRNIHDSIINYRKQNILTKENCEYFENHHIIPKSLGGRRNKENMVALTAREHYVVHELLVRIYKLSGDIQAYHKMLLAWNRLAHDRRTGRFVNSRLYEELRRQNSKRAKEYKPTKETIEKQRQKIIGRKLSEETKRKISLSEKGVPKSLESRKNYSKASKGKLYVFNPLENKVKRIDKLELEKYLNDGWLHKINPETAKKKSISEGGKNNPAYGKKWMYHPLTKERVYVLEKETQKFLDNGFIFGVLPDIAKKQAQLRIGKRRSEETKRKMSLSGKGKIVMHNPLTHKGTKVNKEDVEKYLKMGYVFGQDKLVIEARVKKLIGKKRKPYKKKQKPDSIEKVTI